MLWELAQGTVLTSIRSLVLSLLITGLPTNLSTCCDPWRKMAQNACTRTQWLMGLSQRRGRGCVVYAGCRLGRPAWLVDHGFLLGHRHWSSPHYAFFSTTKCTVHGWCGHQPSQNLGVLDQQGTCTGARHALAVAEASTKTMQGCEVMTITP